MMKNGTANHNNSSSDVEYANGVTPGMFPLETTGGGTEFSQDASGARVMREQPQDDAARTAFLRFRRWRKLVLTLTVLLATVVVIAFVMGRQSVIDSAAYQEGLSGHEGSKHWKLVGSEALVQPDFTNALEKHEYVNFGYKVKIDVDGNHFAIAKQGVDTNVGGGVEVFTHYDTGPKKEYHRNQWFHHVTLKIPPANGEGVEHPHQAVDMSEAGHRIVFNQGNKIHVYVMDGPYDTTWDPLGDPLELPSNHDAATTVFGHEVAMSGDGFFVAVLGYSTDNREKAFVDIFHYKAIHQDTEIIDEWTLVKEITLQSDKGGTMAWDTFGKRLVVGETASAGSPARISVFDRGSDLTVWNQHQDAMSPSSQFAEHGSVVSLSGDGTRLAFGTENGEGGFFAVLQAQPADNGDNVQWVPLGKAHQNGAEYTKFGASLQLSMDGTHLVVGAPGSPDLDIKSNPALKPFTHGQIYLYKYQEDLGQWIEVLPPKRSSEVGDAMGTSVSIDRFGSVVAAGAPGRFPFRGQSSGAALAYSVEA